MDNIEKILKHKLEVENLVETSSKLDSRVESLINKNEHMENKAKGVVSSWSQWAVAASLLVVVLASFVINTYRGKSSLRLAFEESFQLEQQVRDIKPKVIQPVFFMEENKINQEIFELDRQLNILMSTDSNDEYILQLMHQRIYKLKLLEKLYQFDESVYRI